MVLVDKNCLVDEQIGLDEWQPEQKINERINEFTIQQPIESFSWLMILSLEQTLLSSLSDKVISLILVPRPWPQPDNFSLLSVVLTNCLINSYILN